MPKTAQKKSAPPLSVETVSRMPQQGRSKASLERMLSSARQLMEERSNEEFTLIEVSTRGNVSIGSIYLRFESKENLVRAVIAKTMEDLQAAEDAMLARLLKECPTLDRFVPSFVNAYAAVLTEFASILRIAMMRAEHDPQVAEPGKTAALSAARKSCEAMLSYGDMTTAADRAERANTAYLVIFSTLARQLSLGSTRESVTNQDWTVLKKGLGQMCTAYLKAP